MQIQGPEWENREKKTVQRPKSGVFVGFRELGKGVLWLEHREGGESKKTQRKGNGERF